MACRGCGKDNLAVIAKASAQITLEARTASVPKQEKEKRPQYLETACRGCGEIIRQSFASLQRSGKERKAFCSTKCRKEAEDATPAS